MVRRDKERHKESKGAPIKREIPPRGHNVKIMNELLIQGYFKLGQFRRHTLKQDPIIPKEEFKPSKKRNRRKKHNTKPKHRRR
jgi:hypothetical protein